LPIGNPLAVPMAEAAVAAPLSVAERRAAGLLGLFGELLMGLVEKVIAAVRHRRSNDEEQVKPPRVLRACERCGKHTWAFHASLFEVAMICPDCRDQERRSPHYLEACAFYVEGEAGDLSKEMRKMRS
jgi:hypothetical protein